MVFREVTHLSLAVVFSFAVYYDLYLMRFPDVVRLRFAKSGGRLKYLTFWNLLFQTFFCILSVVNDFVGSRPENVRKRHTLQKFLDVFFCEVLFPISMLVCSTFWGLYAMDRELIFPKMFDAFFPSWLNHVMHSVIGPAVILEAAIVNHSYPNRKYGCLGAFVIPAIYLIWTLVIFYIWNSWTYPILEVVTLWQRIGFFAGCAVIVLAFYLLGEFLSKAVWGASVWKDKKNSKSKKKST